MVYCQVVENGKLDIWTWYGSSDRLNANSISVFQQENDPGLGERQP